MSDFWKNKKVLITGHTGFKGSWLTLWLKTLSANVIGYSLPAPTNPSLFVDLNLENEITSHTADILNYDKLKEVINEEQPEIIFHLAAQSLVRYSYENPIKTYSTNIMGTVNLLETIRQSSTVKAAVIVTSDKCYENKEWLWSYRENEPMGGHDPYSSSKGCAELVTASYINSYFKNHKTAIATARAGNVIGGGDWALDRLIPDFIRSIYSNKPVLIRNPQAVRPWQHVLEPLSGYMKLAQALYECGKDYVGGWNFGPKEEDARNVAWIVNHLVKKWDDGASWQQDQQAHPHEAHYLKLDTSKAKTKLDWQPQWSIETTLNLIVDWYKAYQNRLDIRSIILDQIAAYQDNLQLYKNYELEH